MANKTNNYKFPKPEADDFYDISEYNKAMDILDDSLTEMDQKKLDKNGDASEAVTEFEQEILRENIESGETLSSIFGKIKKWFAEMKDVAFSGHAKDITTDPAHRFVSDAEKSSWNGKVGATGGDISETKIDSLELITAEFPIPNVGETTSVFLGKVKKFMQDLNNFKSGIITIGRLVNNGDTTSAGYALDARYGKTLFDLYTKINSNFSERLFFGSGTALQVKNGNTWYRLQVNPDGIARIFKSTDNGFTWPSSEKILTNSDLEDKPWIPYSFYSQSDFSVEKRNGIVILYVHIVNVDVPNVNIFTGVELPLTIPSGYRPAYNFANARCVVDSASQEGTYLSVTGDGKVYLNTRYNSLRPNQGHIYCSVSYPSVK